MLVGVLLRIQFDFFYPKQLEAYMDYPSIVFWSFSAFNAGNVLLLPAILTIIGLIRQMKPNWATWGGMLVVFGLFTRTFHAGVDHLAYQLARLQPLDVATKVIGDSYGAYHIFKMFNLAILLGWIVLAIGAYRSKVLNLMSSMALGLMASLPLGVLKGTTLFSVIATAGLCIALVPLGIKVLRNGTKPSLKNVVFYLLVSIICIFIFHFIGQAG
ncbi:hypothetical protein I6N90_08585 [Paenibacillus sp. GSMTC-2017]|nr:hypothetical protein [Paenibacillus sp. GSMTC-2017]